jgi:S-adenosylmethionine synthetase
LSDKCEIQLAYAIGVAEPVSISVNVNTFGTGTIPDSTLTEKVEECFDFRPQAIIESLGLRSPIFSRTASGGHFGRNPEDDGGFSWEKLDEGKIAFLKA